MGEWNVVLHACHVIRSSGSLAWGSTKIRAQEKELHRKLTSGRELLGVDDLGGELEPGGFLDASPYNRKRSPVKVHRKVCSDENERYWLCTGRRANT